MRSRLRSSQMPATRWLPLAGPDRAPLPTGWQQTLSLPGSLTRQLKRRACGTFQVRVLREGFARPSLDERRVLGLPARQQVWIREVALHLYGTPWVLARTLMPLALLHGPERHLQRIGRRPLGARLFQDRTWQRSHFQVGRCEETPGAPHWARRSCFRKGTAQLLVCEYFMHPLTPRPASPDARTRETS